MATRVTDGARRPRFARLAASPLPRTCIAPTKSEEKERLLAVYVGVVAVPWNHSTKAMYTIKVKAYHIDTKTTPAWSENLFTPPGRVLDKYLGIGEPLRV